MHSYLRNEYDLSATIAATPGVDVREFSGLGWNRGAAGSAG